MGISFSRRVSSSFGGRIFFFSLYFRDRLPYDDGAGCARVDALRVKSRAEHKKPKHCYRYDFQRIRFHNFVAKISAQTSQTDACCG